MARSGAGLDDAEDFMSIRVRFMGRILFFHYSFKHDVDLVETRINKPA